MIFIYYLYSSQMDREDEDFGEGFIAESHPLRPTHLTVPLGGRSDSRAPSISSSVSDLDVPIYTRETTIPLSARKVKLSSRYIHQMGGQLVLLREIKHTFLTLCNQTLCKLNDVKKPRNPLR